jgi:hypothetical protein
MKLAYLVSSFRIFACADAFIAIERQGEEPTNLAHRLPRDINSQFTQRQTPPNTWKDGRQKCSQEKKCPWETPRCIKKATTICAGLSPDCPGECDFRRHANGNVICGVWGMSCPQGTECVTTHIQPAGSDAANGECQKITFWPDGRQKCRVLWSQCGERYEVCQRRANSTCGDPSTNCMGECDVLRFPNGNPVCEALGAALCRREDGMECVDHLGNPAPFGGRKECRKISTRPSKDTWENGLRKSYESSTVLKSRATNPLSVAQDDPKLPQSRPQKLPTSLRTVWEDGRQKCILSTECQQPPYSCIKRENSTCGGPNHTCLGECNSPRLPNGARSCDGFASAPCGEVYRPGLGLWCDRNDTSLRGIQNEPVGECKKFPPENPNNRWDNGRKKCSDNFGCKNPEACSQRANSTCGGPTPDCPGECAGERLPNGGAKCDGGYVKYPGCDLEDGFWCDFIVPPAPEPVAGDDPYGECKKLPFEKPNDFWENGRQKCIRDTTCNTTAYERCIPKPNTPCESVSPACWGECDILRSRNGNPQCGTGYLPPCRKEDGMVCVDIVTARPYIDTNGYPTRQYGECIKISDQIPYAVWENGRRRCMNKDDCQNPEWCLDRDNATCGNIGPECLGECKILQHPNGLAMCGILFSAPCRPEDGMECIDPETGKLDKGLEADKPGECRKKGLSHSV